jgi:type IV secretion system protein VirD4
MQLPPTDEIVMVAGTPPVRAKKVRYYEDRRFQERVLPPPPLDKPVVTKSDDWSNLPLPTPPQTSAPAPQGSSADDEDPTESERRRQPELNRARTLERTKPIDNEFEADIADDADDDDSARISRMNQVVQGIARQVSLDPNDGMNL